MNHVELGLHRNSIVFFC